MKISSLDHFVLTVKNIEKTIKFYESILGMDVIRFADNRVALKFGAKKINLHEGVLNN
ncbi:VOC family protein [Desulfobulbus rhabdoformis]|uniref:VOC family protein n=1 Tax=Desulfobulbus rhabdoformis TaxID=34032 RepID=UPI0019636710|nr:VOC family protein [Desulfobulbus rhabdoformis]